MGVLEGRGWALSKRLSQHPHWLFVPLGCRVPPPQWATLCKLGKGPLPLGGCRLLQDTWFCKTNMAAFQPSWSSSLGPSLYMHKPGKCVRWPYLTPETPSHVPHDLPLFKEHNLSLHQLQAKPKVELTCDGHGLCVSEPLAGMSGTCVIPGRPQNPEVWQLGRVECHAPVHSQELVTARVRQGRET